MSRIHHVMIANIALRKLGGYERWLIAWAERLVAEGETLELWSLEPTLPAIAERLGALGVQLRQLIDYHGTNRKPSQPQVIWAHFMGVTSPPVRAALRSFGVPLILYDHASGAEQTTSLSRRIWRRGIGMVLRLRVTRIVAVSEFVAARDRRVWSLPADKVTMIFNGVETPPAWTARSNDPPMILCVAYLIPSKGIDTLLAAVARVIDLPWRLSIAGDGPARTSLEEACCQLHLEERVDFLGHRNDVPRLQRSADIIVHPARWAEAFGYTVAEAMAAGAAVIATRVGGIPELIQDEVTGILVPPDDPTALADALRRLLTDAELQTKMGRAGRDRMVEHFSMDQQIDRLIGLGREVAR